MSSLKRIWGNDFGAYPMSKNGNESGKYCFKLLF